MTAIQDIELLQHDLRNFTLYSVPAREKDRLRKPLYPHIGKWLITGVLHRSDSSETCLAENIKTGKPVILSYLIPKVEFDFLSKEYENFLKVGSQLATEKRARFLPEGKIKRADCQVRGYWTRMTQQTDQPTPEHHCSECDRKISTEEIYSIRSMRDLYSCVCGNEIRMKYMNVTVPVMIQKYKDYISLKRALITTKTNNCAIPNVIFCWLISVAAKYLLRTSSLPVLASSGAIALCADGTTSYLCTPVGRTARKYERRDIPPHVAKYFDAFLECCPDVSSELARFMALPNSKTLRNVQQLAKTATRAHVRDWLKYVTSRKLEDGEAKQAYLAVQAMIVSEWQKEKPSLEQLLSPTDPTLHPSMVSLSDLQQIQEVQDRKKKRSGEKAERKKSWQRYLDLEPESPISLTGHLFQMLRRVPDWQKYALAGTCSIVILFGILFSAASIGLPNGKTTSGSGTVMRSSPARLLQDSVSEQLRERMGNTVATARILVSEEGRVEQIEWVYASTEQQKTYASKLEYLKFEPAKQNGVPAESWQTIQLPIKQKRG